MSTTAAALRRAFDASFAEPAKAPSPTDDLLALIVGGERRTIRLADVAGLHVDRRVTPVPSPDAAFLGLAAVRGSTIPIFDLGALLGHPRDADPRWFVVSRSPAPVGLAFQRFEGHLRVDRAVTAGLRSIDLASIVEAIARRKPPGER